MDGVQRVGELDQSAAKPRIEVCSTTNLGEGVGETRNGGNPFKMAVDCDIVYKQSKTVAERMCIVPFIWLELIKLSLVILHLVVTYTLRDLVTSIIKVTALAGI